ncbi:S-adenosyl-L-methionine-dependent methyltransferase [Aspergillus undulatus]|uniref:S-adenosyl-L-methionine-dependent methyltransferase n=1 Tax=Aspergillus undulatus TaxID=1810928 RepID=UPI003CCCD5C4
MTGDVTLFDEADAQTKVQIQGVNTSAVGKRRHPWLYAGTTWARGADYGIESGQGATLSAGERVLYEQLSRTAYFYLRQLRRKILPQELLLMGKYRNHMMTWVIEHLLPQIEAGEHPDIRPEWKNGTLELVQQWRASQPSDNNDMIILHAMGKKLVNIVLDALGNQYASYTYTDISRGFFENARAVFSQHGSKLSFKTLDIESDPVDQGFAEGTFDMVVSSNCLHATKSLDETLRHCRKLLRPGGRLVLLEITRDFLPTQLAMSTLPGWFLGIEDGRVWAATVSVDRWDELLKANGFSGVDVSSAPSFCSVIVAQAVDETVQLLREPPVVAPAVLPPMGKILIVGGGAGWCRVLDACFPD